MCFTESKCQPAGEIAVERAQVNEVFALKARLLLKYEAISVIISSLSQISRLRPYLFTLEQSGKEGLQARNSNSFAFCVQNCLWICNDVHAVLQSSFQANPRYFWLTERPFHTG